MVPTTKFLPVFWFQMRRAGKGLMKDWGKYLGWGGLPADRKYRQGQPQVLRLRNSQNARVTSLRMTSVFGDWSTSVFGDWSTVFLATGEDRQAPPPALPCRMTNKRISQSQRTGANGNCDGYGD
jgi:hypothetical protein